MKAIKATTFACIVVLTFTASKCFVSSSFNSSSSRDDNTQSGFFIGVVDVESTSSETVQALTQTLLVADVASQSAQYINEYQAAEPINYSCNNDDGFFTLTFYDLDNSNNVSVGDNLFVSYANCKKDNVIANGELTLTIIEINGVDIGYFESGTDWLLTLRVNTDTLNLYSESKTLKVKGSIDVNLSYDAESVSLKTNITGDRLTFEDELITILSEIDISQLINLAIAPSSYILKIDSMNLTNSNQNGSTGTVSLTHPVSGIESLNLNEYFVDLNSPEKGEIILMGKDSNAKISIMPGDIVSINLDTDGDSVSDEIIPTTWSDIK